ncbi:exopolysaccharide biosynthesis protein [Jannaschia sp. Os4]|uniref:exopolysaccharide biosynthesis protein n=1 Tax=Jannaschia sp. Os4 TaxID=2807617 RepID=UPI00193A6F16|nr:exopolysaccharide biosynthesis protein [Jannaschia sp. Os4]MBM2576213.1 exopolysaccharide biosynthesis protein [Jannaschia sp. Os4]
MASNEVEGVVEQIDAVVEENEQVSVRDVVQGLGERSFGPILLVTAVAMILPVGMIPGVPAVIGAILAVVGWQVLNGRDGIRLPDFIAKRCVPADKLEASVEKAKPWARKLGDLAGHRWEGLTQSGAVLHASGVVLMVIGATMVALGAIPGLPAALAVPVAVYGLGLTANNGVLVATAAAMLVPAVGVIVWLMPWPPWAFLPGLG